jgi:hypothetical protein
VTLIGSSAGTPGYHTNIKAGTYAHPTRESLEYALACLQAGDADRLGRAHDIIEKILSLQDTDPLSPTFGIWSWFYEEPLWAMTPPDWNWADFLGARLAQMLVQWPARIHPPLAERMRLSLERAAMAIFRRNSAVSYTNIAVMGAGVCGAAGELLGRAVMREYGRNKLRAVRKLAEEIGAFSEYNSPTYTFVAIDECERILVMTSDEVMHQTAKDLLAVAWKMIADHWHPPTNQWAGPHGRAYSDRVDERTLNRIEKAIGRRLRGREDVRSENSLDLIPHQPCPADLARAFLEPIKSPRTVLMNLGGAAEGIAKRGYTWLAPSCTLASANRESTWNQRRPVIAYWASGNDVAVFKLQWLMDGRDMPGIRLATSQHDGRLLLSLYPLYGMGPFHPSFEAPVDHTFPAADFRLRFSLSGPSARVMALSDSRFDFVCGDHHVIIDVAPSTFNSCPVKWAPHRQENLATLDAICGAEAVSVNFKTLRFKLAAAIQLLGPGQAAADFPIRIGDGPTGEQIVSWPGAGVEPMEIPAASQPWSW